MAATTLSPHPLGESDIPNHRMDLDPTISTTITLLSAKKKRKSDVHTPPSSTSSKKPRKTRDSLSGKYCHQCHQVRDAIIECTVLNTRGKKTERCGKFFCQECLKRRYDEDLVAIVAAGRPKDLNKLLGHVQTEAYVWRCPVCCKNCNCAPHRKQYGLPPAGFIASLAKEKGLTVAQLLQDPGAMEMAKLAREAAAAATPKKVKALTSEGAVEGKEKKVKKVVDKGTDKPKERIAKVKKNTEKAQGSTDKTKEKSTEKVSGKAKEKAAAKAAKAAAKDMMMPVITLAIAPAPIKPFIRMPKHVDDPEFEFIGISYPLEVIEKRLHVREFVLRFEKKMIKLPPKYLRTINDPNSDWTDLTYRNLITNLLPIIQADGNHLIHGDTVYEAVCEIQKTTADNPKIWTILKNLLEEVYPGQLPDDFDDEETKLEAIVLATNLALQATVIREQIDTDMEREKDRNKAVVAEIKRLKADWDQTKGEFQKERLLLKPGERPDWDDRYARAFKASKKLIALVEEAHWFASRKKCLRTVPLGTDAKGNTYWMFTQRDKKDEDWGQWVVVEKNGSLPHPSGVVPKPVDEPSHTTDDELECSETKDADDDATSRVWYAVSGAKNVRNLAEWIGYQTDLLLFRKATAANNKTPNSPYITAAATMPDSPQDRHLPLIGTPSRHLMVEVRLPRRNSDPVDPADSTTKESTEALCSQLQKIANFMELNEDPRKLI